MKQSIWVFGYGSLIWRPDFEFIQRQRCTASGWARRFWQGSHDHRGTAENPGRVVTLVKDSAEHCVGMGYQIDLKHANSIFLALDHREKNGYERVSLTLELADKTFVKADTYIATEDNVAFLGKASAKQIAAQMLNARGESGANADYLYCLVDALRTLNAEDKHVYSIEYQLRGLQPR